MHPQAAEVFKKKKNYYSSLHFSSTFLCVSFSWFLIRMIRAGWPNSLTLIMAKSNKDKTSVNQASLGLELELSSEVITPDVLHSPRLLLCHSSLCLTATCRPLFRSRQRVIYMDGITKSSAVWGSSLLWICYFFSPAAPEMTRAAASCLEKHDTIWWARGDFLRVWVLADLPRNTLIWIVFSRLERVRADQHPFKEKGRSYGQGLAVTRWLRLQLTVQDSRTAEIPGLNSCRSI